MITKDKVSQVELRRGRFSFMVGGLNSYSLLSKKRTFKTYAQALRYSIILRDYYQVQVVETS